MNNPPRTRPTRLHHALLLLAAACALAGPSACSSRSGQIASEPAYPATPQSGDVDIQVFRDETVIRMTNTTARNFPAGRMWVNRWYGRSFPGLGVGETLTLHLAEFKDQYGDAFRAGGFFATDRPARLVQAQLEIGGELVGLIVVGETE